MLLKLAAGGNTLKFNFRITLNTFTNNFLSPKKKPQSTPGTLFFSGNSSRALALRRIPVSPLHVIYFPQPARQPRAAGGWHGASCGELPPGMYKKIGSACVWTCLTNSSTCPNMLPAPFQKTVGFNHWRCQDFSQTAATSGTRNRSGSGPTLRSRGFPAICSVLFEHTGSGPHFSRGSEGARLPCPKHARSRGLPRAHPGRPEHIFRRCTTRIMTCHWILSHFAVLSLRGRQCPTRPQLRGSPPAARVRSSPGDLPLPALPPPRLQGPTHPRRPSAGASPLGGRRPRPDLRSAAYSPAPALPPGSGVTHSGRPAPSCPF